MTPRLETPRLILRPLAREDAVIRYEIFNDPLKADELGADPYPDKMAAECQTLAYQKMDAVNFARHWTIEIKATGQACGFCDVYLPSPHLRPLGVCEVAFGLLEACRGYGYMAEALGLCTTHMHQREHFVRFEASVSPINYSSRQLLESLGFGLEGIQRKKWVWANQRHDMLAYALLVGAESEASSD